MVIEAVAVTITMYCIIQFYVQLRQDIAQHKPILKVLAIKLVIFLSFWQTIIISFLTSSGAIKASDKIQTPDIKVGIPCLLLCIEMAIFAVFHIWSFSYKPYVLGSQRYQAVYGHLEEKNPRYHGGALGIKAFADAFNPWDLVKAVGRAARWLFMGRKHRMQDTSYASIESSSTNKPSQKLSDLSSVPTQYSGTGSGIPVSSKFTNTEEGSGLLTTVHPNPYANSNTESSATSPWTEVEAKEYLQDQQMRQQQPDRNNYQTATVRPSGTHVQVQPQTQNLPFVTKQDLQNTTNSGPPYPRSMASIDHRTGQSRATAGNTNMPTAPRRDNDGGFI